MDNYHFILSDCPDRPLGIADSFVGQVLPGCIAKSPLQFVIGGKPSLSDVNMQGRTLSIEPGFEVIETLNKFKDWYYLDKCFVFSISGKICEADLENITKIREKDVFHIACREYGYMFDTRGR